MENKAVLTSETVPLSSEDGDFLGVLWRMGYFDRQRIFGLDAAFNAYDAGLKMILPFATISLMVVYLAPHMTHGGKGIVPILLGLAVFYGCAFGAYFHLCDRLQKKLIERALARGEKKVETAFYEGKDLCQRRTLLQRYGSGLVECYVFTTKDRKWRLRCDEGRFLIREMNDLIAGFKDLPVNSVVKMELTATGNILLNVSPSGGKN